MRTIFNKAKKYQVSKPVFVEVMKKDGFTNYRVRFSRESRDEHSDEYAVYRINVYPKNWPLKYRRAQ